MPGAHRIIHSGALRIEKLTNLSCDPRKIQTGAKTSIKPFLTKLYLKLKAIVIILKFLKD